MKIQSNISLLWTSALLGIFYATVAFLLLTAGITQTPVETTEPFFTVTESTITLPTLYSLAETLVSFPCGLLLFFIYLLTPLQVCITNLGCTQTTTHSTFGTAVYVLLGVLIPSTIGVIAHPIAAKIGMGASALAFTAHAELMTVGAAVSMLLLLFPLIYGLFKQIRQKTEE